ncbi:MAG: hypothetical protein ACR2OH_13120 [Microthrixaceae bacterium]
MAEWLPLLGVVIGGMFGLIPWIAGRKDAKRQDARADSRERRDEERRARSHVTGALIKCAQVTHDFLGAWELYDDARNELDIDDAATQLDLLTQAHHRASEMRTAWTEALVVVPQSDPRSGVIREMLERAWTPSASGPELGQLAHTAERALKQLIGTEPAL